MSRLDGYLEGRPDIRVNIIDAGDTPMGMTALRTVIHLRGVTLTLAAITATSVSHRRFGVTGAHAANALVSGLTWSY